MSPDGLRDIADPDFRIVRTMTQLLAESLATLLLIRDDFITLDLAENFRLHFHIHRAGERKIAVGIGHDDITKFYFVAGSATNVGNIQSLVFLDLKLLTGYFYDCEHNGSKIRWAKVRGIFHPAKDAA
jgi:hypothetical protein